jgi:glycosyltransferase involved in cell wall biosynthesis
METRKNHIRSLYITNLGLTDNLGMTQILPYIKGLAEKGIRFNILSYEKKENLRESARIGRVKDILDKYGIKWTTLRYHNRWGNAYDIFVGTFVAAVLILQNRIDVVHARASIPILFGWPLAKILGKKVIYDRRGTMKGDFIDDVNIKNIFSVSVFSGILGKLDSFFIRHSDAVIVLSERARDLLGKNALADKKRVICDYIPCCVDMTRFKNNRFPEKAPADLKGKFTISYVGSLGTCYLLDEMIDFFRILKEIHKNAFFLVISHSDKEMIQKSFSRVALSNEDYKIVDAEPGEVPVWLGDSACSVMFIKEVGCKIGASPTKFAESLAAGVPVIINKGIGDADKIIEKEGVGVIVESLDREGYEKAISRLEELLKDPEGLKNRCAKTAERLFSMELGIEKYKNVYSRI